ncbi:hypothetical protein, partial [Mycobacterium marinum]
NSIVLNPPVPALRPQRRVTKNHQRRSQACKSTTPEPWGNTTFGIANSGALSSGISNSGTNSSGGFNTGDDQSGFFN